MITQIPPIDAPISIKKLFSVGPVVIVELVASILETSEMGSKINKKRKY